MIKKVFLENLPKNRTQINWINSIGYKIKFIYGDIIGEMEIVSYLNSYVWVKYLDYQPYKISVGNLRQSKIGGILMMCTSRQKIKIGEKFQSNNRDLVITSFKYIKTKMKDGHIENRKYYKYTCNICGWTEGFILENRLIRGQGCSCCTGLTIVEGINDIPTTAPWMVKYFQGGYEEAKGYTRCSTKTFYPICPDCERIKDKPMSPNTIYSTQSIGCSCSDGISYPEKFMMSFLKCINQPYIYQFSKNNEIWCMNYRYDFVIQHKNLIIETDGIFHFNNNQCKNNDIIKNRLADDNGYKIIRLNCMESSMNWLKTSIMSSALPNILNFKESEINWYECHAFGLNNLSKQICNYKYVNPSALTSEIREIFQVSVSTIIKYLKYGNELGWCTYNKDIENINKGIKFRNVHGKRVEVFKDGESLGIYPSCKEIERISIEKFGVKLLSSLISTVAQGKRKIHKGYAFKYV